MSRVGEKTQMERLNSISRAVIGCAFKVHNTLGAGFLEKVYDNALAHEIRKIGYQVEQQRAIQVRYDEVVVGDYAADLVVAGEVMVELKVVKAIDRIHLAQCLNYLKATGMRLCLLMNFSEPRLVAKRVINGS